MKLTKYIAVLLSGSMLFACDNFEDINTSPDSINKATPALMATGAIMGIMKPSGSKNFVTNQMTTKHIGWAETIEGAQYNNFGRNGFGAYTSLKDYKIMVEMSEKSNLSEKGKNAYKGLALFLKAYQLFNLTLNVGEIPYEGILGGAEGALTVPYNTQKEVFQFLLEDLDQAHEYFQNASNFAGDPIFSGNVKMWNKQVNTLELRILINLSKKTEDADLKVIEKFNEVMNRKLLQTSNSDNLQLNFINKENHLYPFHESLQSYGKYVMISTTVIDVLKANQDYRLFYYANPAKSEIKAGKKEDDFEAYVSVDPSMPYDKLKDIYNKTLKFCILNNRYTSHKLGEPYIRIGYAELNFTLAEAALRGWISGDASSYYKKGIEASMNFVATHTPDETTYNHGRKITSEVITETLANPIIQLTGNFESDLEKIITQKYIAGFMQLPYQTYYDYRRTGYPEFPINPLSNQNSYAPDKMPMRWMYPENEYDYNKANVDAAVQRQFGGSDDVNQLMWILK